MTNWLLITFVGLCLLGCADSRRDKVYIGAGEFLVPTDKIPNQVAEIADALEQFSRTPTQHEFESVLTLAGLAKESDWYKDQQHMWYFDANFNSTSIEEREFMVTIGYWPEAKSKVLLFDAGIHRIHSIEGERETIWKIEYSK